MTTTNEKTPARLKMEASKKFIELKALCEACDYELLNAYYDSFLCKPVIGIRKTKRFQPEIYFYAKVLDGVPTFKINAGAFGSMEIDEYNEFLKELNNAGRLVEMLNKVSLVDLIDLSTEDY